MSHARHKRAIVARTRRLRALHNKGRNLEEKWAQSEHLGGSRSRSGVIGCSCVYLSAAFSRALLTSDCFRERELMLIIVWLISCTYTIHYLLLLDSLNSYRQIFYVNKSMFLLIFFDKSLVLTITNTTKELFNLVLTFENYARAYISTIRFYI